MKYLLVLAFVAGCGASSAEIRLKNECKTNKKSYDQAAFLCRSESAYIPSRVYYCDYARRYEALCWENR